jgi:hypothetical protein
MTAVAESTVEEAALSRFEELGYTIVHGPDIAPGDLMMRSSLLPVSGGAQCLCRRASVGAESAKMLLVFVLARKRRSDLMTVRAVAERRIPERSGVDERRATCRQESDPR